MTSSKRSNMVYTPEYHIPVGEAIITEDGEPALRIKKPKGQEFDVITLGKLAAAITQKAKVVV